ncbi:GNAT family N-acetyltransferase [Candidatus Bathyarchaeota archaeon]|nr:GNAT family N-acetyltransferase [Candidatus Bathyarchaeota archaeon]
MPNRYDIQVFTTVDDIGKDSIDAISGDSAFTYGWFKTIEHQTNLNFTPKYFAAYESDKLIGLAPCFLDTIGNYFSFGPHVIPFMSELMRLGERVGIWQKRILVCYSPFCYRSKILLSETCSKKDVLHLLLEKIDYICKKERILFSSFLFVSEFDKLLSNEVWTFHYKKFPWKYTYYIDVNWSNFEEYLTSLTRWSRKTIRRDIKKCRENGVIFNYEAELGELSEKLSFLHSNLFRKHNKGHLNSPYQPSFFKSLNEFAGDSVKVFIAQKKGKVMGFSLRMGHKNVLDSIMVGFDYDFQETDCAYFNLAFYEPIKWAIKKGFKKIYYRFTAEEGKIRRGCKREQIFTYVKCYNRFLDALADVYVKRKYKNCLC